MTLWARWILSGYHVKVVLIIVVKMKLVQIPVSHFVMLVIVEFPAEALTFVTFHSDFTSFKNINLIIN